MHECVNVWLLVVHAKAGWPWLHLAVEQQFVLHAKQLLNYVLLKSTPKNIENGFLCSQGTCRGIFGQSTRLQVAPCTCTGMM